jgi:hypothetical protein
MRTGAVEHEDPAQRRVPHEPHGVVERARGRQRRQVAAWRTWRRVQNPSGSCTRVGLVSSPLCEMENRRPFEDGGSTIVKLGGGERTRTADFYVANVALCQLSYTPDGSLRIALT